MRSRSGKKIVQTYQKQEKTVKQAQILNYLALAYQQQGEWQKAEKAIAKSLKLVENDVNSRLVFAEAINTLGTVQLAKGQAQQALKSWQQAIQIYQQVNDKEGKFRTKINQSRALRTLGLYPLACQKILKTLDLPALTCQKLNFEQLTQSLDQLPKTLTSL